MGALPADGLEGLLLGLLEHGPHLGLPLRRSLRQEQRQGLGEVGGAEHRALQLLEVLVELGVAAGAGQGLPQKGELGFGALDAGGLGRIDAAALAQASRALQCGEAAAESPGPP